jgi:hydroxyacylglutathione hydrolase
MPSGIKIITLSLPYGSGNVNCYLLGADGGGYILIDTGGSNNRTQLEAELKKNGCKPGVLRLIILTHGDFDHTGNAAYLREKFGSKIAMHYDDSGMTEQGDLFFNRKMGNTDFYILWVWQIGKV